MREEESRGSLNSSLPPVRSATSYAATRSKSAEPPLWGLNSRGDSLYLYQQFSEHPMHDYTGDWNSRVSRDMKRNVLKEFRTEVRGLIDTKSKQPKKKKSPVRTRSPPERVLFEREEGFRNRLEPKFTYGEYDALKDRHCPYVHSRRFRKSYTKYLEIAEAERPAMKKLANVGGDTTPWVKMNTMMNRKRSQGPSIKALMGLDEETDPMANQPKRLSTALKEAKAEREAAEKEASEAMQERPKRSKLSCELEAYKCIVLREGYLQRLKEIFMAFAKGKGRNSTITAEVANLFFSLRLSGLGVVEAISEWRDSDEGVQKSADSNIKSSSNGDVGGEGDTPLDRTTGDNPNPHDAEDSTKRPFLWNGQNYLLKMQNDLDFVDEIPEIVSWLGFSAMSNPFLIPSEADDTESGDDFVRHLFYNREGIVVFNKTTANPLQSHSTHRSGMLNTTGSSSVNPEGSKASVTSKKGRRSKTPASPDRAPAVMVKPKSSSHINLERVRAAEATVLEEQPEPEEDPDSQNPPGEPSAGPTNDGDALEASDAPGTTGGDLDEVMAELDLEGCF